MLGRLTICLLALTGTLAASRASPAYEDLGLRPRWADPALAETIPDLRDRMRRIDSIESSDEWLGAPTDSLRLQLIRLYRASPLMKHRVRSIELARELPLGLRAEQLGLGFTQTYNPWEAREQFAAWAAIDSTLAAPFVREGVFLLNQGLAEMNAEILQEAVARFRRATTAARATPRAWRGLAAALTATRQHEELRTVAETLLSFDDSTPGALLFAAVAHEAAGLPHRALQEFEQAMARMGAVARQRYETPGGPILHRSPAPHFADVRQLPESLPRRGWWVRLTESELLFSDPDAGRHGWDTAAGEAYLLFGRPTLMRVVNKGSLSEIARVGDLTYHHDEIGRQLRSVGKSSAELWLWIVSLPSGRDLPLVFERFTPFAQWRPSEALERSILVPQREAGAIRLASSLPEVVSNEHRPGLSLLCRGFPSAQGRWRVEAWVSTRPRGGPPPAKLRARFEAGDGRTIEELGLPFGPSFSRTELRRLLPELPGSEDGWLHGLGVVVEAASVLLTLDLLGEDEEVLASRDARLDFRALARTRGLGMSELMPCDVYREGLWDLPLHASFLRHGMVVLPRTEPVLAPDQVELSVYYEVFGAAVTAAGQTKLDVEYTVYASEDFDPYVQGPHYRDGDLARPVIRIRYPDARTGRTPAGTVIKGTRIPVGDLDPGAYVLNATVTDRLARQEARRSLLFGVPPRSTP